MENELTERKRAAIYIRLSSEEQAKEGYSPQTQKEKALEFIKSNGYEIDERHIYVDLGYSGATDKRPALQRLLEDARKREFNVIVEQRKGPDIQQKIEEMEKRIAFWKNKEKRLAELYSEGIIDLEIYKKQWEECKREESKLLEKRELLSQSLLDHEEMERRVSSLRELYQRLKDSLENASRQIKYEIVQRLIEKIVVKGNTLEIEYNFPFLEPLKVINKNAKGYELSSFCFKHEGISCKNKTFKVFIKVELLPRSEVSKRIWARRRELAEV